MAGGDASLAAILDGIGRGGWPPADGGVLVLPPPSPRSHGVLGFAARHLVPHGELVWAQVAPGNAASVRAILAAGFAPVGAEALLVAP
jgi:hypothetical protein